MGAMAGAITSEMRRAIGAPGKRQPAGTLGVRTRGPETPGSGPPLPLPRRGVEGVPAWRKSTGGQDRSYVRFELKADISLPAN